MELFTELPVKGSKNPGILKIRTDRQSSVRREQLNIPLSAAKNITPLTSFFLGQFLLQDRDGTLEIPLTKEEVKQTAMEDIAPHFERITRISHANATILNIRQVRRESEVKFKQLSPDQETFHLYDGFIWQQKKMVIQ